jgi:hypothetical protein
MSINNSPTPPQVRVRTPGGIGILQKIWRLGDLWMSTVDHTETLQLYPLDTLRPARTDAFGVQRSHVVRRRVARPSLLHRFLALIPLAATIALVGTAWLVGAQ